MKNEIERDNRIKAAHISWKEYLLVLFVLETLTAGQAIIGAAFGGMRSVPREYITVVVIYWAVVTLIFCLVTSWQRFHLFDKPMRKLSAAAKQVAAGDFSVFVEPMHVGDKKDYVDVMFDDFNRMVKELGSIETLKNDFIANVSHEIKAPLAVIESYAQALQKDNLSPESRREYTDTIISASKKLSALVTNILKLNKLENQEIKPAAEAYDLCRQLSACALSFEDVWEQKNIEFSADIEDKCMICADESMLEIVWNNLLSNALKFTEPGGAVTLTQTSEEDAVTVTVSDTGCGMDKEAMKHIFDKFYQGDSSHTSEGNGLGLALAQKVIDLLDGALSVRSAPGQGTSFTVKLRM
jgi:signal transduction histidine kinase